MMLRKPTCSDCPHNLQYMESLPIKKKRRHHALGGVFLCCGKAREKIQTQ